MEGGLSGWTPVRVGWPAGQAQIEWCNLGAERFTDPFFEQTLARVFRDPARLLFRRVTPMEALEPFAVDPAGPRPSGFIFHWSRCGSTLLAQMLAALPQNVVVSEAPPLDQVLGAQRYNRWVGHDQRVAWFRGMLHAIAQRRHPSEQHVFVKFDSWHILELPLILEAFPDVPWVFLYRDPVEIMVSQHRTRGTQMIPGVVDARLFDLDLAALTRMTLDEYGARVLYRIAAAASTYLPLGHGRLVNYTELPNVVDSLGRFFGGEWAPADRLRMASVATRNATTPALPHADDTVAKQREASADIRRLAGEWLSGIYAQLEAQRAAQAGVLKRTTAPGRGEFEPNGGEKA